MPLIRSKLPEDDPTSPEAPPGVAPGGVAGYEAEQVELDPAEDTVEQRVNRLIAQNSPGMIKAETRAKQGMNSFGLLNSSMTTGAIESARYDYALPIAQPDAASSIAARMANTAATNRATEFTAGNIQQQQIQQEAGDIESQLISERGDIDLQLQSADAATRELLLNRQGEIDAELATLGGDISSKLQAERGEIDLKLQSADAATRLKLLERQGAIDFELQGIAIAAGFEEIRLTTEASSRLQTERGEIDKQLQAADAAARADLLAQQGVLDFQLQELRGTQQVDLLNQKFLIDKQLQILAGQQEKEFIQARADAEAALQTQRGEIEKQLQDNRAAQDLILQDLRGTQAERLATIDAEARVLAQTSQSAAIFYAQTTAGIAEILSNPDIPVDQKQGLIDQMLNILEGGLAVIGGIADLDLPALLDFTNPDAVPVVPGDDILPPGTVPGF